jgi:NOL1/NOP2/sun family putative RNA methylase
MLPPIILNPARDDIVMDLCSAPGSKTTQMSEMMDNDGTLIVNEVEIDRIKSLVFNLDRMSVVNTGIIHSKGEVLSKYYHNRFDKILVDAPCSGLGIIQKKEEVSNWWSLNRVQRLQDLQTRLLIAAIKMAKVGGEIVYSTCTLSVEENEMVIDKILSKYPVEIEEVNLPVKTHNAFTKYNDLEFDKSLSKAVRILPWEINSDGFFLVKLRKVDDTDSI